MLGFDLPVAPAAFFVGGGEAEDLGPEGPGGLGVDVLGRAGIVVELEDGAGPLAVAGPEAIGRGIAAAHDDHVLARGQDRLARRVVPETAAILLGEERHRHLDALELAAGDVELAWAAGACRQQEGVRALAELGRSHVAADLDVEDESYALGLELNGDPTFDVIPWPS